MIEYHVPNYPWRDTILISRHLANWLTISALNNQIRIKILFPKRSLFQVPPKIFCCTCFIYIPGPKLDCCSSHKIYFYLVSGIPKSIQMLWPCNLQKVCQCKCYVLWVYILFLCQFVSHADTTSCLTSSSSYIVRFSSNITLHRSGWHFAQWYTLTVGALSWISCWTFSGDKTWKFKIRFEWLYPCWQLFVVMQKGWRWCTLHPIPHFVLTKLVATYQTLFRHWQSIIHHLPISKYF